MGSHKPSVLKIASEKYVEVLKDHATSTYYAWNPPCLGGPDQRELREGHISGGTTWKSEHVTDPWENLMLAVCRQAVNDYIHYYRVYQMNHSPFVYREMKRMEEDYFRKNEATEVVFEELLRRLRDPKSKSKLKFVYVSGSKHHL